MSLDHRGELMLPDDFSVISKANCSHQVPERQVGSRERGIGMTARGGGEVGWLFTIEIIYSLAVPQNRLN